MTEYEFRAAAQAGFGEEAVTDEFMQRLFERLRDADIHIESIYHAAPAQPSQLELWAKVQGANGTFERKIWIARDLGIARMHDTHPPRPKPPEEPRRRESPPEWVAD